MLAKSIPESQEVAHYIAFYNRPQDDANRFNFLEFLASFFSTFLIWVVLSFPMGVLS